MSSSISAAQLNAALARCSPDERDQILLKVVAEDHIDGVYQSLDQLARKVGAGGLSQIEMLGPFITQVGDNDVLELNVGTRISTENDQTLRPWVPIGLTAPMRAGIEVALAQRGLLMAPETLPPQPPPLKALSPEMRVAIFEGLVDSGRKVNLSEISAVTIGNSRYMGARLPDPTYFAGHPGDPVVLAAPLPPSGEDVIYVTVHSLTSAGTEQRLHVFKRESDGHLRNLTKYERIIGLGR